jgi:hypothetical protein
VIRKSKGTNLLQLGFLDRYGKALERQPLLKENNKSKLTDDSKFEERGRRFSIFLSGEFHCYWNTDSKGYFGIHSSQDHHRARKEEQEWTRNDDQGNHLQPLIFIEKAINFLRRKFD